MAILGVELDESSGDDAIQQLKDAIERAVLSGRIEDPNNKYSALPTLPTLPNSYAVATFYAGDKGNEYEYQLQIHHEAEWIIISFTVLPKGNIGIGLVHLSIHPSV